MDARQAANKRRDGLPWDRDLLWYAREAPGALGERSIQGAVEAALRTGGPGKSVASSDAHHDEMIKRLGAATRARRIYAILAKLDPEQRTCLEIYYTARVKWPSGMLAHIGDELASVALAYPPDGDDAALRRACACASLPGSKGIIARAKKLATKLVIDAHSQWDAWSDHMAFDFQIPGRNS